MPRDRLLVGDDHRRLPGCGRPVAWYGTCLEPGGGTAYVVNCPTCRRLSSTTAADQGALP